MRTSVWRTAGRASLILAIVVAAVSFATPAAAITGQLRVMYVLATWGPRPFTTGDVERVMAETNAFFAASSAGRFSFTGDVVDWVTFERSAFDRCSPPSLRETASRSMSFAGYDRVVFIIPFVSTCEFSGVANGDGVVLNGRLYRALAAHELGHTLGLGHASAYICGGGGCRMEEYGSRFSTMGNGAGDFNAYEKTILNWLNADVRVDRNGSYEIGPIEGPTTSPQALVVNTAASEFWFESRSVPVPPFQGGLPQPPSVAVVAHPRAVASPFPRDNVLLPNPAGGDRYGYVAGESFVDPGVFRVTVDAQAVNASLRFEWLDSVPPARPRLRARALRNGRVRLEWDEPAERGSGLGSYSLLVDGKAVRQLQAIAYTATVRTGRGLHRVGIAATDRAGNRGFAATVRLRLR